MRYVSETSAVEQLSKNFAGEFSRPVRGTDVSSHRTEGAISAVRSWETGCCPRADV